MDITSFHAATLDTTRWAIGSVPLGPSHRGGETWGQDRDIHSKAERTTTDHDLTPHPRALSNRRPTGPPQGPWPWPAPWCPGFSCGLGPPSRLRHTLFPAPAPSTRPDGRADGGWQMASSFLAVTVLGGRVRVGDPRPSFPTRRHHHHHHHPPPHQPRLSRGHPAALPPPSPSPLPRVPSLSPPTSPDCICMLLRPVRLSAVCPPLPPAAPMALHSSARSASPPAWIAR